MSAEIRKGRQCVFCRTRERYVVGAKCVSCERTGRKSPKWVPKPGQQCKTCGSADRTRHGSCRPCTLRAGERWRRANMARVAVKAAKYRAANPARYQAINRKCGRRSRGFAPGEHERAEATLPGTTHCVLCGILPTGRRGLQADHDHATGLFRAWICTRCNVRLGVLESPWLYEGFAYLKKYGSAALAEMFS